MTRAAISSERFFKSPFKALAAKAELASFTVLDIASIASYVSRESESQSTWGHLRNSSVPCFAAALTLPP
jgi:hypothetical protein